MPRHCSVVYCKSNYNQRRDGSISCFSLPKDGLLRKIWMRNMRTDMTNIKNPYVCIKHFCEEDVIWEDKCTVKGEVKYFPRKLPKLREGAVPKIHCFPSTCKNGVIYVMQNYEGLEVQSNEEADEVISQPNAISKEILTHGRLLDSEQQSVDLKNTFIHSYASNVFDEAKSVESPKSEISNFSNENMSIESPESPGESQTISSDSMEPLEDCLDESSSEVISLWTNNNSRVQLNQDIEEMESDTENNELIKELVRINSQIVKYLENSNKVKQNMLQEMKLSNKLKLAELKIKCRRYDLDLDIINK